jgi:hypothetical protein
MTGFTISGEGFGFAGLREDFGSGCGFTAQGTDVDKMRRLSWGLFIIKSIIEAL